MANVVIRRSRRKREVQTNWGKKAIWLGIIASVVLLGAAAGYAGHLGFHWYQVLRHRRMIWQANSSLQAGDLRGAIVHAQRALQLNPKDIDALIVMAKIFQASRPDEAIPWRKQILDSRPEDSENAIELAQLELKVGRIVESQRLLDQLQPRAINDPDYHKVAGLMALAKNNPLQAEEHFKRALELYPEHGEYQLMLGKAQLLSGDVGKRADARARLIRISQVKPMRSKALGAVIDDMLRTNEPDAALTLAKTLVSDTDASFEDQLLRVDVAHRLNTSDFSSLLHTLQDKSLDSTDHILELMTWLQDHGLALLVVDWIKGMPQKISLDSRMKLAAAQAYASLQNWDAAKEILESGGNWGEAKFLALALQARIYREQARQSQFQETWNAALLEAGKSQDSLIELSRIVESWQWPEESEAALWKVIERPSPPDWVFKSLKRRCATRLDSNALEKLWLRKHELDPTDLATANDLALVSLLRSEHEDEAHKMAADAYLSNQSDTHYASTYAFSLYKQGKVQEALKILSSLPADELRDPSTAVCYVAVLTANNDLEKASQLYPGIDRKRLLPEEKKLLDQVGRTLRLL